MNYKKAFMGAISLWCVASGTLACKTTNRAAQAKSETTASPVVESQSHTKISPQILSVIFD